LLTSPRAELVYFALNLAIERTLTFRGYMNSSSANVRTCFRFTAADAHKGIRCQPIAGRGKSPVTTAGPNFMPRESVGCRWTPPKLRKTSRRAYFFGAHDENRVEFTKGRDVILAPGEKGDPLGYFQ